MQSPSPCLDGTTLNFLLACCHIVPRVSFSGSSNMKALNIRLRHFLPTTLDNDPAATIDTLPFVFLTGEVAVQLMHLFTQATINAANPLPQPPAATTTTGPPSPLVRSNTATNAARAVQIAAARALGRTAAASSACRSTVIRLARDPQLLARLLSALRCPLTAEEMEVGGGWRVGGNVLVAGPASSCVTHGTRQLNSRFGLSPWLTL